MTKIKRIKALVLWSIICWSSIVSSSINNQSFYAIDGAKDNVIVGITSEDLEEMIINIDYRGFSTAIDSLVSFFYLSKNNYLKEIIDMHYENDGSKRYIQELLLADPSSFSGSKNLKSLRIYRKSYVGKHEVLFFEMEDVDGNKIKWMESFICNDGKCLKSNSLNLFGNNIDSDFYSEFVSANKHKAKKPTKKHTHIKYFNNAVDGYPIDFYILPKSISDKDKGSDWYIKLKKLIKLMSNTTYSDDLDKYLPQIFNDWGKQKTINFLFSSGRMEKDWFLIKLSNTHEFEIKGYVETLSIKWVYASGLTYNNKSTYYLFAYNKSSKKFEMKSTRLNIAKMIMNKAVEAALFDNDVDELHKEGNAYKPQKEDKEVSRFYNKLEKNNVSNDSYKMLMIPIFLLVIFALFYVFKKRR